MSTTNKDGDGKLTRYRGRSGRGPLIYRKPKRKGTAVQFGQDWFRRVTRGGQTHYFNLGPDRDEAARRADALEGYLKLPEATVEEAQRRWHGGVAKTTERVEVTVGDILKAHEALALDVRSQTARKYRLCLQVVVRRALGGKVVPCEQPASILTGDLVRRFQAESLRGYSSDRDLMRRRRSANSVLRNARAMFGQRSLFLLREVLPELSVDGFLREPFFQRVSQSRRWNRPQAEVVHGVFGGLEELRRDHPQAWMAVLLALCAGLRRSEIAAARSAWLADGAVRVQVEEDFTPKSRESRSAGMPAWAFEQVKATAGHIYVLDGSNSTRYWATINGAVAWLRARGLGDNPLHQCRKLYGAWVASTQSLFVAQRWLGHASAQITSDFYADVLPETWIALWAQAPQPLGGEGGLP